MRILGSRLLTTLVIANVVLGVMAVGADWLARKTYWPFEPPGPHHGLVEVASDMSTQGQFTMKCYEGFGRDVPNYRIVGTYGTNELSFTCENVRSNDFVLASGYRLSMGDLTAEWENDFDEIVRVKSVVVAGKKIYPFEEDTQVKRIWVEDWKKWCPTVSRPMEENEFAD